MQRGLFITFEGIDGCGKSTQAWLLAKHIWDLSKYNHLILTREPWKNAGIRKILTQDNDAYSRARELAKMYVEDRKNHVDELIEPFLSKGIYVISDRYSLSTLAYQSTQGIPLPELIEMHRELPMPDLTFIVNVPFEVARERMKKDKKRKQEQKFEKDETFIRKLIQTYLDISKQLAKSPKNIQIIDGSLSPEEIFEHQIKPVFDKLYNSRYA